jgi:hypothetical protein
MKAQKQRLFNNVARNSVVSDKLGTSHLGFCEFNILQYLRLVFDRKNTELDDGTIKLELKIKEKEIFTNSKCSN